MADGRLPLTILGGFLGAGKSSWARHHLHEGRFSHHHILVNEAAGTPVDNLLLGNAARLTVLAGGCACCEGLPDLLMALREICNMQDCGNAEPIEGLMLETSGLADPAAIAGAISTDPILARRLRIVQTLVLVDALHGLAQLSAEPLARSQIEAADQLIITKAATGATDATARLIATLQHLNPGAAITGAELGLPFPLPAAGEPCPLPALGNVTPIRPFRLNIGGEGGWIALSTWLSALLYARGEDVVRVKGVVRTPAGRLLLQSVRRMVQPPEILPDTLTGPGPEEGVIILIGRNFDAEALERSWLLFGA